jgi:hypothetical protein
VFEKLTALGGKYNQHLKGGADWIYSKRNEATLRTFVNLANTGKDLSKIVIRKTWEQKTESPNSTGTPPSPTLRLEMDDLPNLLAKIKAVTAALPLGDKIGFLENVKKVLNIDV